MVASVTGGSGDRVPIRSCRSLPRLTELPVEILEQMLLHLPGQDIIEMEVVRGGDGGHLHAILC